jgi:hypothetical protein
VELVTLQGSNPVELSGEPSTDGVVAEPRELSQELSMVEEVRPEHLRQCENPSGVGDIGDDSVLEQPGEERGPLGATGGAAEARPGCFSRNPRIF